MYQFARDRVISPAIQHDAAASAAEQFFVLPKARFGRIPAAVAVVGRITLIQQPAPAGIDVDIQHILLEPRHADVRDLLARDLGREPPKCVQITNVDPLRAVVEVDQPARVSTQPQPFVSGQLLVLGEIRFRRGPTAQVGLARIEEFLFAGQTEEDVVILDPFTIGASNLCDLVVEVPALLERRLIDQVKVSTRRETQRRHASAWRDRRQWPCRGSPCPLLQIVDRRGTRGCPSARMRRPPPPTNISGAVSASATRPESPLVQNL